MSDRHCRDAEEEEAEDEDDDSNLAVEDLAKDLRALKAACRLNGEEDEDDDVAHEYYDDDDDSVDDDEVLLQAVQKRFGSFAPDDLKPTDEAPLEEEDDEEILRAVQRRFASGYREARLSPAANGSKSSFEGAQANHLLVKGVEEVSSLSQAEWEVNDRHIAQDVSMDGTPFSEVCSDSSPGHLTNIATMQHTQAFSSEQVEVFDDPLALSDEPVDGVVFDVAGLTEGPLAGGTRSTLDALKKNRLCQKMLRNKLSQLQSKLEEITKIRKQVKSLIRFRNFSKKRCEFFQGGNSNRDSDIFCRAKRKRIRENQVQGRKKRKLKPPLNEDVAKLKAVKNMYSLTFEPRYWSKEERTELMKGVKQQVQEIRLRTIMENFSAGFDDADLLDNEIKALSEKPLTPGDIQATLPIINWNEVARVYVTGRTPTECKIQWCNYEDPSLNRAQWIKSEDKRLWSIAKGYRLCHWDLISEKLGTNRTAAQCLTRYQRSLNAGIVRSSWTEEEDEQLRKAVSQYGEDWQAVAASLEGRTGPQCWNRWHKILHPLRKRSGRWSILEDVQLVVSVTVYGPRIWKTIATHVTGRTEVQCRERWCNVIDPSIVVAKWTAEEDRKLEAAVRKHGLHRWATVANDLKPRTDNQCWRRWKYIHPEDLVVFQQDCQIQRTALVTNFVGRKKERPRLGPADFIPDPQNISINNAAASIGKGKRKPRISNRLSDKLDVSSDGGIRALNAPKVTHEHAKASRMKRMERLRQARATGRLPCWKLSMAVSPGYEKRELGGSFYHGKSTATSFIRLVHEVACFCQKNSECMVDENQDVKKTTDNHNLLDQSQVIDGSSKIDEIEAAVKGVLSWPFFQGLQAVLRNQQEQG